MNQIKSSCHYFPHLNSNKLLNLNEFLTQYQKLTNYFIDYLWNNKITFTIKSEQRFFDIKNDYLEIPTMLSSVGLIYDKMDLSERAVKCSLTQALGIIRSRVDKRRKIIYVKNKLKSEGKRTRHINNLLKKNVITKPKPKEINAELNSNCIKFEKSNNIKFDCVLILSSIGKKFGKIIIPINFNKHSNKLNGQLKNSFLLSKDRVYFRWEQELIKKKEEGIIAGLDTGIRKIATLSNNTFSAIKDSHGKTLSDILKKISRRKKGSKGFKKAIDHRDNFINYAINSINFEGIKQINLENISNFRYKKNVGKFLNYFTEGQIKKRIIEKATENGVQIKLQDSFYRSQRCSKCGYVHQNNRDGELFRCKHCGFQTDADLNASSNHEQKLPSAKVIYRCCSGINRTGFYWKESGFYDLNNLELAVPDKKKV